MNLPHLINSWWGKVGNTPQGKLPHPTPHTPKGVVVGSGINIYPTLSGDDS